ncbi:MAG: hypothetical protein ACRDHN_07820 [Thermomicrobiales bacterium]
MPATRLHDKTSPGSSAIAFTHDIRSVLRVNEAARWATCGLGGVIVYLFIGRLLDPGFTNYWWYQLFQTSLTLTIVLFLNGMFAEEGGMAWQTHAIVVGATLADTLGTAGHMYEKWGPYDKVVHFSSGAAFAAGIYQALAFMKRRGVIAWDPFKRGLMAVLVSFFVIGFIWETYEYMSDVVFGSGRVHGWGDTIGDLIADTTGAILAIGIIRRHERLQQREIADGTRYGQMAADQELILHPVQGGSGFDDQRY